MLEHGRSVNLATNKGICNLRRREDKLVLSETTVFILSYWLLIESFFTCLKSLLLFWPVKSSYQGQSAEATLAQSVAVRVGY